MDSAPALIGWPVDQKSATLHPPGWTPKTRGQYDHRRCRFRFRGDGAPRLRHRAEHRGQSLDGERKFVRQTVTIFRIISRRCDVANSTRSLPPTPRILPLSFSATLVTKLRTTPVSPLLEQTARPFAQFQFEAVVTTRLVGSLELLHRRCARNTTCMPRSVRPSSEVRNRANSSVRMTQPLPYPKSSMDSLFDFRHRCSANRFSNQSAVSRPAS